MIHYYYFQLVIFYFKNIKIQVRTKNIKNENSKRDKRLRKISINALIEEKQVKMLLFGCGHIGERKTWQW